jgi:hypothetical protein
MFRNWFKNFFLQWFIEKIYRQNKSYFFPIVSHAPRYFNLAFPDFSIQYYILSLSGGEHITLEGEIPRNKIVFWSVCLYDNRALPFWNKNDSEYPTNRYIIPVFAQKPTALIVRFYVKDKYKNEDFYKYLPKVQPLRDTLSKRERIRITNKLYVEMKKRISQHFKTIDPVVLQQQNFFLPGNKRRQALFTNPNAFYLALCPKNEKSLLSITLDTKNFVHMRFVGFMSCNYQTTETIESYSLEGKKSFTFYICHSKMKDTVQKKYKPKKLILFGEKPIIIYRLVIVQKNHPFLKLNEKEDDTFFPKIEQKMKQYYPTVKQIQLA